VFQKVNVRKFLRLAVAFTPLEFVHVTPTEILVVNPSSTGHVEMLFGRSYCDFRRPVKHQEDEFSRRNFRTLQEIILRDGLLLPTFWASPKVVTEFRFVLYEGARMLARCTVHIRM